MATWTSESIAVVAETIAVVARPRAGQKFPQNCQDATDVEDLVKNTDDAQVNAAEGCGTTIQVCFRTDRIQTFLEVPANRKVADVKHFLLQRMSAPPSVLSSRDISLKFAGKTLALERTLLENGVTQDATLCLELRLRGGGARMGKPQPVNSEPERFVDVYVQPVNATASDDLTREPSDPGLTVTSYMAVFDKRLKCL